MTRLVTALVVLALRRGRGNAAEKTVLDRQDADERANEEAMTS